MALLPLFPLTAAVDPDAADAGERALLGRLGRAARVLVAFSGGVDSTYVAWAARRALGERSLAVTGLSDSVAAAARAEAPRLAEAIGIAHLAIATEETRDPRYLANDRERCYWCKSDLYARLAALAAERGFDLVVDGTNRDDLGDIRPGRRAAAEHGVVSPLVEAGLGKDAVRWLSRRAGLPTWDRPASPCLSSRVPFGSRIDAAKLARIDRAEQAVAALGFREFRVRHLGDRARIEVAPAELAAALAPAMRERLRQAVTAAGFDHAEVDEEPFRSGRLHRAS